MPDNRRPTSMSRKLHFDVDLQLFGCWLSRRDACMRSPLAFKHCVRIVLVCNWQRPSGLGEQPVASFTPTRHETGRPSTESTREPNPCFDFHPLTALHTTMPKPRVLLLGRCHADGSVMDELRTVADVHILPPIEQREVAGAIARAVQDEGPFVAVVVSASRVFVPNCRSCTSWATFHGSSARSRWLRWRPTASCTSYRQPGTMTRTWTGYGAREWRDGELTR